MYCAYTDDRQTPALPGCKLPKKEGQFSESGADMIKLVPAAAESVTEHLTAEETFTECRVLR